MPVHVAHGISVLAKPTPSPVSLRAIKPTEIDLSINSSKPHEIDSFNESAEFENLSKTL